MDAVEREGDDARLLAGGAEDGQPLDLAQALGGVGQQPRLVGGDGVLADGVHVVDGGAQPDRFDDRRGAGLEAVRRLGVRSEEHTSEFQSLMRISYAVFCLKKKKKA